MSNNVPDPERVFLGWLDLLEFASGPSPDPKTFKIRHDALARHWSKLSITDQGMVSEMIQDLKYS